MYNKVFNDLIEIKDNLKNSIILLLARGESLEQLEDKSKNLLIQGEQMDKIITKNQESQIRKCSGYIITIFLQLYFFSKKIILLFYQNYILSFYKNYIIGKPITELNRYHDDRRGCVVEHRKDGQRRTHPTHEEQP